MREIKIQENEAGQRFDKYLAKLLAGAPKSFFYKMMRKKNITLNGKKATGNEKLACGDSVRLFLSEETFEKFAGREQVKRAVCPLDIVYEDEDVLLINKPAGMLSQPDAKGEPSLVEYVIGYLLEKGTISESSLSTFKPSVCNRLDRNTSGIVAAGKSLAGLQSLSQMFRERTMHKYYLCLVQGIVEEENHVKGFLKKDEKTNKVTIYEKEKPGALPIETRYRPLDHSEQVTLLEVELITGRPHQIRAHLAECGHAIIGDTKYGKETVNRKYRDGAGLTHQLLHAYKLVLPQMEGKFEHLSGKTFTAPVPELFYRILKEEHLEESYYENLA